MRSQPFTFRKIDKPGDCVPTEGIEIRTRYGRMILEIASGQSDDVDVVRDGARLYVVSRSERYGYAGVQAFELDQIKAKGTPVKVDVWTASGRTLLENPAPVYLDASTCETFEQNEPETYHPRIFDVSAFTVVRAVGEYLDR